MRQSSRKGHELGGCFKALADLACARYQHLGSRLDGVDKATLEECSLWFFLAKKEDGSGVPPKELDMEGLLSNKYDDYTITDGEYFSPRSSSPRRVASIITSGGRPPRSKFLPIIPPSISAMRKLTSASPCTGNWEQAGALASPASSDAFTSPIKARRFAPLKCTWFQVK